MRRSRNPTSSATSQSSSLATGSSGNSTSTNTVPSLLKELHGLVLRIQVLIRQLKCNTIFLSPFNFRSPVRPFFHSSGVIYVNDIPYIPFHFQKLCECCIKFQTLKFSINDERRHIEVEEKGLGRVK